MTVSLTDVVEAADRLRGVAAETPVLTSRTLDERVGARVFCKAENLQRGGAFKFRGAYSRMSLLSPREVDRGVAAYSSGNHGQAVALAARLVGTKAVVVMPADAPPEKLEATKSYGAEVVLYDRYRADREALGKALCEERGLTLIPPYEDPLVMAGQGTAGLELVAAVPDLELLVVPVGGGGLIAGCATAAKGMRPLIEVAGVEPAAGDDTKRSLELGVRVALPEVPPTIADGLQATSPGRLTLDVNERVVDRIVTVSDDGIVEAMAFLFERMKVVVEPSGAVGVAALLTGRLEARGRRVGVLLSGGNISAGRFARLTGATRRGGSRPAES